ncbi:MAG: iron chelate uptake ABC transporter family permease subunit [Vulcanimicrobiota bacterium]
MQSATNWPETGSEVIALQDSGTWNQVLRVLSLSDYNTRVVILGTAALGVACGLIGSFMLLRKRSLMADTISHATLPGIAFSFMLMVAFGGSGKWLPGLLLGAALSGLLGMGLVLIISRFTRIKEDAALGIVLSVFFGLGVALLGLVQKMSKGSAAGLESFIYGKTASMLTSDALLIGAVAALSVLTVLLLFKEFCLLCFDQDFAAAQGFPVGKLDVLLMTMVVLVTVIGLQAVGLILVIALLIIPPAAARFWTEKLTTMALIASVFGGVGGALGAALSAVVPKLPAGAVIVLTNSLFFALSLVFGSTRGVLVRFLEQRKLSRKVGRQHLMRALFECLEKDGLQSVSFEGLLDHRSWSASELHRLLHQAERAGLISQGVEGIRLSAEGELQAARIVRNHRLWELFLINYADIAPSHVDRGADRVEHVLDPKTVHRLEELLDEEQKAASAISSPHPLGRIRKADA